MNNVKANRVVVLLSAILALLTAPSGVADAAPAAGTRAAAVRSICETGYRGNPEYDRKCLVTGTFKSGATLWLSVPEGRKGHVGREDYTRRSICAYPGEFGTRDAVTEALTDVAYDHYRNYRTVLRHAADTAVLDCRSMGYRIVKG